jgi:hypothetical protein
MRKCQNHKFEGYSRGIAIDFDKDPVSKRNRNYEQQRKRCKTLKYMAFLTSLLPAAMPKRPCSRSSASTTVLCAALAL